MSEPALRAEALPGEASRPAPTLLLSRSSVNDFLHLLLRDRTEVTVPLGFVLAVLVTIHVLLRQREVASAVGWIAFAWFAPITGSLIYVLFGINRVRQRARLMRPPAHRHAGRAPWPSPIEDDHLDPLDRGIGQITARPLLAGNAVAIYHDGDAAYPPMLAAIEAAKHSIGLSSYIFRDDRTGGQFIDALAAAHDRGVTVCVLIDGIGGGWLLSPVYHRLRARGVPAARFLHSPLPWRMPFLNLRSHRKILVVDGNIGFTGGINIADENVLATHPKKPVSDTHFRIQGPAIAQLAAAFAQDWAFATGEGLAGDAWFPDLADTGTAPARVVDSGPDEDIEKVEFAVLQAVACAQQSIAVMTPYFLPDGRLVSALSLAAMRGVSVDIVVPQFGNHHLVNWATYANIGPLLSDGVRIWQCPPPFRHSKVMVVDGEWCLIGSCNWDIRSFRLNFELCMEVYDRDLAATLAALMQECRGAALTQQTLDARSLPIRLRDAGARLMMPYL
jgi:cardiolipin synthase A/B